MTLFSNLSDKFQILDYSPTHSQLLIRSMKLSPRDYNIDVIVKPVYALCIPSTMNGLEISLLSDSDGQAWRTPPFNFVTDYDYKIFKFADATGASYAINAMALGVFHNRLD